MDINLISYFDYTHKPKGEMWYQSDQWRTGGGVSTPPLNSEVLTSRNGLQIEQKMFSVPIPKS